MHKRPHDPTNNLRTPDCTCEKCVRCCVYKPGWFIPGEAEQVADVLGYSLDTLFHRHLMVDYWVADTNILILSPATTNGMPGQIFPSNPLGQCGFLTAEQRCSIHAVKPYECAVSDCQGSHEELHASIADLWKTQEAQQQIGQLLGDPSPTIPTPTLSEALMFFMKGRHDTV